MSTYLGSSTDISLTSALETNRSLRRRLLTLETEVQEALTARDAAVARTEALNQAVDAFERDLTTLSSENDGLIDENSVLRAQIGALEQSLAGGGLDVAVIAEAVAKVTADVLRGDEALSDKLVARSVAVRRAAWALVPVAAEGLEEGEEGGETPGEIIGSLTRALHAITHTLKQLMETPAHVPAPHVVVDEAPIREELSQMRQRAQEAEQVAAQERGRAEELQNSLNDALSRLNHSEQFLADAEARATDAEARAAQTELAIQHLTSSLDEYSTLVTSAHTALTAAQEQAAQYEAAALLAHTTAREAADKLDAERARADAAAAAAAAATDAAMTAQSMAESTVAQMQVQLQEAQEAAAAARARCGEYEVALRAVAPPEDNMFDATARLQLGSGAEAEASARAAVLELEVAALRDLADAAPAPPTTLATLVCSSAGRQLLTEAGADAQYLMSGRFYATLDDAEGAEVCVAWQAGALAPEVVLRRTLAGGQAGEVVRRWPVLVETEHGQQAALAVVEVTDEYVDVDVGADQPVRLYSPDAPALGAGIACLVAVTDPSLVESPQFTATFAQSRMFSVVYDDDDDEEEAEDEVHGGVGEVGSKGEYEYEYEHENQDKTLITSQSSESHSIHDLQPSPSPSPSPSPAPAPAPAPEAEAEAAESLHSDLSLGDLDLDQDDVALMINDFDI